jgi:hypothetical protein
LPVRGHPGSFSLWTVSQSQRGCCRHPLSIFGIKSLIKQYSKVVSGVGMPMLTEFRLWVLSTIVMVALVIFLMKLPLI